ncbi:MAG: hypothetical protein AB8V23_02580 [Candidatus Midichloria sp.]
MKKYLEKSDSLFVNASSWGLFLQVNWLSTSYFSLNRLIRKLGEPVLLPAIKR